MRRKLPWFVAGFAVLFAASSGWAPPPVGGGGGRPVGGGSSGGRPIGGSGGGISGSGGRPIGGASGSTGSRPITGSSGRPIPGASVAGKTAKVDFSREFNSVRVANASDAAKLLRERGPSTLSRPEHAALLNAVTYQILRQHQHQQMVANQRFAALRQLRADWNAVGPGAGLNPALELQLAAAEAAAEKGALTRALGAIKEKQYLKAATELSLIHESRHLPVAIARAIPELEVTLLRLIRVSEFKPEDALPSSILNDNMPVAVKKAIARVETLGRVETAFARPESHNATDLETRLAAVERAFGATDIVKLRVELSAALFLAGKFDDATALLKDDVAGDHARAVLADLRQLVSGGGTLNNAQVARLIVDNKMPPAIAPLVPLNLREKWVVPKPPTGEEPTLAKLTKQARKDVAMAASEEKQRLTERVNAAAANIEGELTKLVGLLAPFNEKTQARLGRPIAESEERELVALAALRGMAVDDAVSLVAAEADRPAQAARLFGAGFTPVFAAHAAVASQPPQALKPGDDGGFKLPAESLGRERAKIREAIRAVFDKNANFENRPAFEDAVAKELGLPDAKQLPRVDVVFGLLDVTRDAANAARPLLPDVELLQTDLGEFTEADYDDPVDKDTFRHAKEHLKSLAGLVEQRKRQVELGCRLLGDYGADASPALPWLRIAATGSTPWSEAAANAVRRLTEKPK